MSTASALGIRTVGMLLGASLLVGGCSEPDEKKCTMHVHELAPELPRAGGAGIQPSMPSLATPPIRQGAPKAEARGAPLLRDPGTKIVHERVRVRRALRKEIAALEADVTALTHEARRATPGLRSDAWADVHTARAWHERLVGDLEAVDRADDVVWDALRDQVDRDLAEVRPPDPVPCEGEACRTFDL